MNVRLQWTIFFGIIALAFGVTMYFVMQNKPREFYLREAIRLLLECDMIALLPGWEDSAGAQLEVSIAKELAMPTICAENL